MTDSEFAKHRGVSRQTVDRWRKRGFLVAHPDGDIHRSASDAILNSRATTYRGGQASKPVGARAQDFTDLASVSLAEARRRKKCEP